MVSAKFQADFTSFQTAVQKAELSLKSFETGAGKVEKSLNKMGDSFSGVKVIQDANLAAAAIEKIGGASKLTQSEQARVNSTITEALAKYKALGMEAPAALQSLANATANVEKQTSLASKGADLLKSSFGQFTAANLASSAIQSLTGEVQKFIGQGVQLRGVETSFQRLSAGVRQNSNEMLSALQTGTRGMVANIDLMTQANKAMLLGLPVTTASMGDLAKAATTLGKAMGQDATKSLDDLITALGRSSPMILDNLGLTVKVGEANDAYAKKLHKTAEELTDAEKKTAFYEAAMEAARKKTAELGEQTKTLGEIATTVWTDVGNVVSATASAINVAGGRALSSSQGFVEFLGNTIRFGSGAAITMGDLRQAAEDYAKTLGKDVNLELPKTVELTKAQKDAAEKATKALRELKDAALELAERGIKAQTLATRELLMAQMQTFPQMHAFIEEHRRDLILIPPVMKDWAEANKATTQTLKDMVAAGLTVPAITQKQIDGFLKVKDATKGWQSELMKLGSQIDVWGQVVVSVFGEKAASAVDDFQRAFGEGTRAASGFARVMAGDLTGLGDAILGTVNAAKAAWSGFTAIFDRDKGRDLVENYVKQFGGFDGIQKIFADMGEEGARLWKMLTQGKDVHDSPDAARRAIEEVTKAIEEFKKMASNIPEAVFRVKTIETRESEHYDGGVQVAAGDIAATPANTSITVVSVLDGREVGRSVTEYQNTDLWRRGLVGAA